MAVRRDSERNAALQFDMDSRLLIGSFFTQLLYISFTIDIGYIAQGIFLEGLN